MRRAVAAGALALAFSRPASAEVPATPDARGREFRVDFSARHLEVDADLGELSLSGDVVVTVGRYRLGGQRVKLQRGPRGVSVEGGGDIAFCSCEAPPVTLGYSSVTIAPPSDVLVENAVLRAGGVPLFWLPYLWLRSPDRVGLIFPSVEWRGDEGLLIGSGVHVPFDSNQGRPAARALDIAAFGYVEGGARVDARLLTPQSTSLIRWDYLDGGALTVDAHAAASGETAAIWAYDVDASRGERGRSSLTSLEAAGRAHDHARLGAGSVGSALFALGAAADGRRGDWLSDPLHIGPFGVVATGGALGRSSSYALDMGAGSWFLAGEPRARQGESRAVERASFESALLLGPVLTRAAAFEQAELVSLPSQAVARLRAGAGLSLALPLLRRFGSLSHTVSPQVLGRFERQYSDGTASNFVLATGGLQTALGRGARAAAGRLWVGGGAGGDPSDPQPLVESIASSDARFIGLRLSGVAEPRRRAAEGSARLRLGARGGTHLVGYAEGRTDETSSLSSRQAGGDLLPAFHESGAYDRPGLTTGGELTLSLPFGAGAPNNNGAAAGAPNNNGAAGGAPNNSGTATSAELGGGVDLDPVLEELLALRSFARYRHACSCFAVAAFASSRVGRGGFDAGLTLDLMP